MKRQEYIQLSLDELLQEAEDEDLRADLPYKVGDRVKILSGIEKGWRGIIVAVNPRQPYPYTVEVGKKAWVLCPAENIAPAPLDKHG